jgi:hypothetical protein
VRQDSVFGYIASRSGQPENVATEALNYVLNGSVVAKRAFLGYVAQTKVELPDTLLFRAQAVGEDNAIPDLVGMDSESRQVFLVEAKFWAGLTSNQPVIYLKRLPSEAAGLLLFIAPARRFDTLWAELLRRCRNEGFVVGQPQNDIAGELKAIGAGTRHTLALTSWRAVLAYMLRALETEGEHHVASATCSNFKVCASAWIARLFYRYVPKNSPRTQVSTLCSTAKSWTRRSSKQELGALL